MYRRTAGERRQKTTKRRLRGVVISSLAMVLAAVVLVPVA